MVEINRDMAAEPGRYDMACLALSFLCGVLAASLILPGVVIMLGSFLLSAAALVINRKRRTSLKAAFMLVVFLSGMLDYSLAVSSGSELVLAGAEPMAYECVIRGNPVDKGAFLQYTAKCTALLHGGKRYNFHETVFLKIDKTEPFEFGDKVSVTGISTEINGRRNPGDFDYRLYYKSKGINRVITADGAQLLEKDSAGIFSRLLYLSKEKVKSIINQALPSEEAAILTGIIIGDKGDIDEDTRDAYMKTGLSHILSVSGLHVVYLSPLSWIRSFREL
jgi:competence protein ComEC